jgi:hypothetical protein
VRKEILVLVVMALLASPAFGLTAASQDLTEQIRVDVVAHVDPAGNPPWIKAKWEMWMEPTYEELVDADPYTIGTQGDIVPGGNTYFYSFVIVSDPNGIEDLDYGNVYVDVYHPTCGWGDGSFKYQVHAYEITPPQDEYGVPMMDVPIFYGYTVRDLLDKGVAAGYFTAEEAAELWEEIHQNDARIYVAELEISYHQPYGWYRVEAWATDNDGGQSDKFINYFEVRPMLAWETDFNTVEFANVKVGTRAQVSGDYDLNTPFRPTVRNLGNTPIILSAYASDATSNTTPPKHFTDIFDMRFLNEDVMLPSFEWFMFSNMLPPCNTTKIDFSLHLPQGAPASDYSGYILLKFEGYVLPCDVPESISDPVQPWAP